MNGIGNLKKKNHRWKFILHVNLHRRYYVCGVFFFSAQYDCNAGKSFLNYLK